MVYNPLLVALTRASQNGPIRLLSNYSLVQNPYAWSNVADYVWIDQPVGTGFSTVDINGYAPDVHREDRLCLQFHFSLVVYAPTSKNWVEVIGEPFGPNNICGFALNLANLCIEYATGGPSVEPMAFLTELATNATAHDVSIVIYSGNDDSVPHFGSQSGSLANFLLQLANMRIYINTTFGGIQGFTRKPETPWYNDAGEFAGIVHQERGWKCVLVANAGHLLGNNNPISALTLVREFIFGNNQTGLVTNTSSGGVSVVVGGEMTSLGNEILTGAATTASSYFFPSATVEAWNAFISTATPSAISGTSPTPSMGLVSSKVFSLGSALAIALVLLY
ncbi:hypothetical protein JVT61DRAFT_10091 [Boletus reticuloceps]|uniref:Uncharacterized protein n=1 Tax=Boletus reticuloceps TaxID=495285 RepID=A0A8I2YW73_9AGAM|nr:hypothetical protein JVT61DRAFT_10091 [Boletus reticuloceps]